MSEKSNIEKALKDMDTLLTSVPGLDTLIKALQDAAKQAELSEEYERIKLPYVSAEPIRGAEWSR